MKKNLFYNFLNVILICLSISFSILSAQSVQEIVWSKPVNQNAVSKYGNAYKLVNDFENILTAQDIINLSNEIDKINNKGNFNITIVTVDDYAPYNSITSLGKDLHSHWKIGKDKKGESIVILFSKTKKTISIVNTMEKIPHNEIDNIINNVMLPHFSKKDFYNGFLLGLKKCAEVKSKYLG